MFYGGFHIPHIKNISNFFEIFKDIFDNFKKWKCHSYLSGNFGNVSFKKKINFLVFLNRTVLGKIPKIGIPFKKIKSI